jgi:hypothetical protein
MTSYQWRIKRIAFVQLKMNFRQKYSLSNTILTGFLNATNELMMVMNKKHKLRFIFKPFILRIINIHRIKYLNQRYTFCIMSIILSNLLMPVEKTKQSESKVFRSHTSR